jgi:hypothetical protein
MAKKNNQDSNKKNKKGNKKEAEKQVSREPRKNRPGMKKQQKTVQKMSQQKGHRKYSFLPNDSIEIMDSHGKKVRIYRIQALRTFGMGKNKVKVGTLGGYVGPENLDQKGSCWVKQDCRAFDDSRVEGNAVLENGAQAIGNSIVMGDAIISGPIIVDWKARISGSIKLISKMPEHVVTEMTGIGTYLFTKDGLKKIR